MIMSNDNTYMVDMNGNVDNIGTRHAYIFDSPNFYILFEKLRVDSYEDLVWAVFGTSFLAAIINVLHKQLKRISYYPPETCCGTMIAFMASSVDAFFHYMLMLMAMTFNIYIVAALAVGRGLGHVVNLWLEERSNRRKIANGELKHGDADVGPANDDCA